MNSVLESMYVNSIYPHTWLTEVKNLPKVGKLWRSPNPVPGDSKVQALSSPLLQIAQARLRPKHPDAPALCPRRLYSLPHPSFLPR